MKTASVVLLGLTLAAGDPTAAKAATKLAGSKSFAFTMTTKFEGDNVGGRAYEQPVAGAWEKPDKFSVKVGRAYESVRKGARAAFKLPDADGWLSPDEASKLFAENGGRGPDPVDLLNLVQVPSVEVKLAVVRAAGWTKEKEERAGCVVWTGPLTKDAAKELAKSLLPGGSNDPNAVNGRSGKVNPPGQGGGYGGYGGGNAGVVKEATGTVTMLVGKDDEQPHELTYVVEMKVTTRDGVADAKVTRTWKFEKFDESPVEIEKDALAKMK